jgi:hypothetical protein
MSIWGIRLVASWGRGARRSAVALVVCLAAVVAFVIAVRFGDSPDRSPEGGGTTSSSPTPSDLPSPSPSSTTYQSPTPAPSGKRYFVYPGGDDSAAGTRSAPWRTLEKALTALRAGDTLTVGDGTYDEELTDVDVEAGTPSEPISVVAEAGSPRSRPVLRGLLWLQNADYWSFRGLNVTWADSSSSDEHMVKFDGGTGWSFTDAEVSDARTYAAILVTGNARNWRLADLFVHATQKTHSSNQDHLIYVSSTDGGGLIEHCLLTDSPNGRAVKLGPPGDTSDPVQGVTVRYNTMYDNLGPSNIQLSRDASDNRIYRNILARPGADEPNVRAFKLEGEANLVYQNLVFDSTGAVSPDVEGLEDAGGNVERDPKFADPEQDDFHPLDDVAKSYGRYAGESE